MHLSIGASVTVRRPPTRLPGALPGRPEKLPGHPPAGSRQGAQQLGAGRTEKEEDLAPPPFPSARSREEYGGWGWDPHFPRGRAETPDR